MKTLRVGLVALAGLAAAGVVGAVLFFRPLAVPVAQPADGVPVKVYGLGTVEARVLSRIGFDVPGTLVELNADHGDRVARGTVLARLDARSQEARVRQAAAAVSQAAAALREAEAGVLRAEAVLAQSHRTGQRKQALVRTKVVSEQAAEDAQAAVDVATADVQQARGKVAVARANLEQAEATLAFQQAELDRHALVAPYDALIVARRAELGTALKGGDPVFTVVDPESRWILAYVDESRAGDLAVGDSAEIRLRSQPGRTFEGRIERIDIESDRVSEERKVYVACATCGPDLHLGEQAEVILTTGHLNGVTLVPLAAVEPADTASATVWTIEDGALARRTVALGRRTLDGRVEITGGLPPGARVVTRAGSGLRIGRSAIGVEEKAS